MHVQDVLRAAAFVQVVNVLGDHQEVVAERLLEAAERHRGSRAFLKVPVATMRYWRADLMLWRAEQGRRPEEASPQA